MVPKMFEPLKFDSMFSNYVPIIVVPLRDGARWAGILKGLDTKIIPPLGNLTENFYIGAGYRCSMEIQREIMFKF